MSDFNIGDIVEVRKWDDMVDEFGMFGLSHINTPDFAFVSSMKKYCGKQFEIVSIRDNGAILLKDIPWKFTRHSLLPVSFTEISFSQEDLTNILEAI